MKNKNLLLIVVGVVLVLAIVAFFLFGRGTSPLANLSKSAPDDLVTSAISGSGSVKCEYTDDEGHVVTAYIKGGNMRTDLTGGQEGAMSIIYKDKTSWTWDNTTKQGMKYTAPKVEEADEVVDGETQDSDSQNSDEIATEIEQYKESCKNESVDDSMFDAPADVTFQDYSQMMPQ